MKKVKLGIIGCGIAAKELHWPALKKLKKMFEIKACCSNTGKSAYQYSKMVGDIPYFTDYRELFKLDSIEAVAITVPINLNYEITKASLEAGKHVIVEKPLAQNLEVAEEMVELSKKYETVSMLAENFRYVKAYREVKEVIEKGIIGKPYSVIFNDFNYISPNMTFALKEWRVHHKHIGGLVYDSGIHRIAAMRLIFGDLVPTAAFVSSAFPELGILDMLSMQFVLDNDRTFKGIYTIAFSKTGHREYRMIVLGSKGNLLFEARNNSRDYVIKIKSEGKTVKTIICDDKGLGIIEGIIGEFTDFHNSICTKKQVKSTFNEGYKDIWVLANAIQIAEKS